MRVTVTNSQTSTVAVLQQRVQQLSELQGQLSSGKKVQKASDDPAAAARAERALAAMQRNEAHVRALEASRTSMTLGEAALGDATEMLQQARELLLRAGAGSFTFDDRRILAEAVRGLRQDLLAVANRNDGAGRWLFGGQGGDRPPLLDTPGGVVFQGSPGLLRGDAGEPTLLALDGRRTWLELPDPANPGALASVFDFLDRASNELSDDTRTPAQAADTVTAALAGVDAALGHLSAWRSRAGEALNRIDGIAGRLAQGRLDAEQARSEAEDIDMVAGISAFQSLQTSYDAALKTYSMVQRMSLFDYLR